MENEPLLLSTRAKRLFGDIRFWLALVFMIRMIGITAPPLENVHSWRQSFTNMVARNLAEGPFDPLEPRTDLAGERTDVVASEFPGFNMLIATLHRCFGPAHWYGRLLALITSTLGAWAFHGSVRRRWGDRVAFLSAFVLVWSAWFLYGRKSMPDTFSISLVLIALYAADRAVTGLDRRWFLLAIPMAALGGLCKIPAIVLCAPWGLVAMSSGLTLRWRSLACGSVVIAMMPVFWWYFQWQPHLLHTYGNQLYFPFGLVDGYNDLLPHMGKLEERFRYSALMSHVAFGALLWGLWHIVRKEDRPVLLLLVGIGLPFGLFILKTGDVFALHAYYILPLVPLMALLAGIGLAQLPAGRWTVIALVAVVAESAGARWSDLTGGAERAHLLHAEELADRYTGPEDLVITPAGMDPRPMYYLHRHGWNITRDQAMNGSVLDSLNALGAEAIFVDRHLLPDPLPRPLLYEDVDWRVYGSSQP